jgi:hypothetical protein
MTSPTLSPAKSPKSVETHTLKVLNHKGDSRLTWTSENADEVAAARQMFDTLKEKRYLAYTVSEDGTKGEVIR